MMMVTIILIITRLLSVALIMRFISLPLYFGIRSLESHLVDLPCASAHCQQKENTINIKFNNT